MQTKELWEERLVSVLSATARTQCVLEEWNEVSCGLQLPNLGLVPFNVICIRLENLL